MPQQFFTNTIENKFIKAMLRNFPIPLIPSITDGEMMIEGCTYIYNTNIVKCTQTGKIKSKFDPVLTVNEEITVSENLVIGLGYVPAKFDIISYYIWGDEIPKITQKYISRYDYYDPETHYYLGQYLRYMRDLRGIDLMPFYNCFNCTTINDIILDKNAPNGYTLSHSDAYKTVCVPIKFNKKYTIAIDSNSRVLMKSIFYGKLGLLKDGRNPSKYLTDSLVEEKGGKVTEHAYLKFNQPVLYEITTDEKYLKEHEQNLCLVIQLPLSNNSSIVVLEGDYTFRGNRKIFNAEYINEIEIKHFNNLLLSKLSLLQFNDNKSYPFSNRLIEYLLSNVIDSEDEIRQNIARVQLQLQKEFNDIKFDHIGNWDRNMRYKLFEKYITSPNRCLDINGFVDKDMEKLVMKGAGL